MINKPPKEDENAWLEFVSNPATVQSALIDKDCPLVALERAIELFPDKLGQIAFNPLAPSALLELAYESVLVSDLHKKVIVEHKNVTKRILSLAIHHRSENLRAAAAKGIDDPELIRELAKDPNQSVRFYLAQNPFTPRETLEDLIDPYARNVAAQVLKNPHCTEEIFKRIAKMPFVEKDDSNVTGYWVVEPLLANAPKEMLDSLLERAPHNERHHALKNPHVTVEMMRTIFDSTKCIQNAESINAFSQKSDLPDDLVLLAIRKIKKEFISHLARFVQNSKAVVDALIAFKSKEIYLSLISNKNVEGQLLSPLIETNSDEVLRALAKRTYSYYDKEAKESIDIQFKNRESLWEVVDSLINRDSRIELSLRLYGQPFIQTFNLKQEEWFFNEHSVLTRETVEKLLYGDEEQNVISLVIPNELLNDFEKTPLNVLADFICEDDDGWSDWAMFDESRLDDCGFEILGFEVEPSGNLKVNYCKWVHISFSLKVLDAAEARSACVTYIPEYLRVWEQISNDLFLIYRVLGSLKNNGLQSELMEEWYLDESLV